MVYLYFILLLLFILILYYFNSRSGSMFEHFDITACNSCAVTGILPNIFPKQINNRSVSSGFPIGNYKLFTETSYPKPDLSRQEKFVLAKRNY